MDAVEFQEWAAVYGLTRFGDVEADRRAGTIVSWLVNFRPFGDGRRDFTPEDFFPRLGRDDRYQPEQNELEMRRNMEMFVTASQLEFGPVAQQTQGPAETPGEL